MTITHRFIGIDISKAHLDIYDDGTASPSGSPTVPRP